MRIKTVMVWLCLPMALLLVGCNPQQTTVPPTAAPTTGATAAATSAARPTVAASPSAAPAGTTVAPSGASGAATTTTSAQAAVSAPATTPLPAPGTLGAAIDCAALAAQDFSTLPDAATKITSATLVAASGAAPAYCKISGTIAPGSQFVLQLPATGWNGDYFQSGCGGFCGQANPNADCQTAFSRGAAIGASDLGHQGGMNDMGWALTQDARLDFAYRANHQLAVAAKAILAAYYGKASTHTYFVGCSDGGREALMEAQRYPTDFDGIVAGAPAYLLAFLNTYKHAWQWQANTDSSGNPILTSAKATVLHNAVLAACDKLDGVADGLLTDPRQCTFDPATLLCPTTTDGPTCLTQAQVDAARKMYSAPLDAQGVAYYPGPVLPYGSELRWVGGGPGGSMDKSIVDSYFGYLALPLAQQDTQQNASSLKYDQATYTSLLEMAKVYDASSTDLTAFRDRGGKLILYHGWADDSISPFGTIAYYAALQKRMGGLEATQKFARLFMFPGVYHCSGGEGPSHFDLVTAIVNWVEGGTAPDQIVAIRYSGDSAGQGGGFANPGAPSAGGTPGAGVPKGAPAGGAPSTATTGAVVRTLPAYPYPLRPQYTGTGDINDARNYAPVMPASPTQDDFPWIGQTLLSQ